jgi:hypothetical protein
LCCSGSNIACIESFFPLTSEAINPETVVTQGKLVGEGARSMVMQYKSGLLQTLTTLVWSIPLVLGLVAEQVLHYIYMKKYSSSTQAHFSRYS